jgi:hypothetical protein
MPPDVPRSASDEEYAAIVSYILKMNQFPPGQQELSKDAAELDRIAFSRFIRR